MTRAALGKFPNEPERPRGWGPDLAQRLFLVGGPLSAFPRIVVLTVELTLTTPKK